MRKNYNHPQVLVAPVALESMVLAVSPTPASDQMPIGGDTDSQW